MEFEREELEIIKSSLEERQQRLCELIEEWSNLKWQNLDSTQNMFKDKQSFESMQQENIKVLNKEYNNIDKLLERVYEEI